MLPAWTFATAQRVVFGPGQIDQLPALLAEQGRPRVFVVTDRNLDRPEILGRVRALIEPVAASVEVFAEGQPEPSVELAETALAAARATRPDVVIGLGGGSNIDVAKVTAVGLAHGGSPRDFLGQNRIPGPIVPLVAIPTTAGTGSEVSGSAVLSDKATASKQSAGSAYLRPWLALVDPDLTMTCPPKPTADSGIDALVHAIEATTNRPNEQLVAQPEPLGVYQGAFGLTDCLADRAIQLVAEHLPRAFAQGTDRIARCGMAEAALLAGMAFSNAGVGIVHALEYPIGVATGCSHGEGNGLLLPHVMRFNLPANPTRFAQIAQLLGCDPFDQPIMELAAASVGAVERLLDTLGIPRRLRDLGLPREALDEMAAKSATMTRLTRLNPRPVGEAQLREILAAAW